MSDDIEPGTHRWTRALVGVGAVVGVGASALGTASPAVGHGLPDTAPADHIATCANQNPGDAYNFDKKEIVGGTSPHLFDAGDVYLQYAPSTRCVRAVAVSADFFPTCPSTGPGCVVAKVFLGGHQTIDSTSPIGSRKAVTPWVNDRNICQHAAAYIDYGNSSPWGRTDCH